MATKKHDIEVDVIELGLVNGADVPLLHSKERASSETYLDDESDTEAFDGADKEATESAECDEAARAPSSTLQKSVIISLLILLGIGLILFNKTIFDKLHFPFPLTLTTWHLVFATLSTQTLRFTTKVLDGRNKTPMTTRLYCTSILPIGILFSLSLMCGNMVYLYLTVAFIQMLKAATPVVVLLTIWAFRLKEPNLYTFLNVMAIAFGVCIASFGEVSFNVVGLFLQIGGIVFEALRLVLVQKLLTPDNDKKMDPLVSLYYFAPACAVFNGIVAAVLEGRYITIQQVLDVGLWTLLANAAVAFLLNVVMVLSISMTSSLTVTLSGVVKTVLLIGSSVLLFGEHVSILQIVGFTIASVALLLYQIGWDTIRDSLFCCLPRRSTIQLSGT